MGEKNIPVYDLNVPNGGPQAPISITKDQPIYSSYTGNLVSWGPIPYGTISDAPVGHSNYKKPFHVIEYNPVNRSFMTHFNI